MIFTRTHAHTPKTNNDNIVDKSEERKGKQRQLLNQTESIEEREKKPTPAN